MDAPALGLYGKLAFDAEGQAREQRGPGMENKVWYLRQNRLFGGAGDRAVDDSEHIFKTCIFPKKSLIFDQGDPTRIVYLIKRGKVRITRLTPDGKEVTVAVLGAGDIFGEETLFDDQPRTTHAVCIDECLLCTAKADDLFALLAGNPTLAMNVAKILSERLVDASAPRDDLASAISRDRLMHLFVRLASEHGVATATGTLLDVRLTHADIASLIGSTRETVSLEIANLARAGRIGYDGKSITLPRAERQPS
ncbi:MAG: Crp/Fnr family transcriptional regulator [Vulcanimicrobiaceae bacterium]